MPPEAADQGRRLSSPVLPLRRRGRGRPAVGQWAAAARPHWVGQLQRRATLGTSYVTGLLALAVLELCRHEQATRSDSKPSSGTGTPGRRRHALCCAVPGDRIHLLLRVYERCVFLV